MAWQWRKSKTFPGGPVRLTATKKGLGVSGFRLYFGADGKRHCTISVPGTGLRKTEVVR